MFKISVIATAERLHIGCRNLLLVIMHHTLSALDPYSTDQHCNSSTELI